MAALCRNAHRRADVVFRNPIAFAEDCREYPEPIDSEVIKDFLQKVRCDGAPGTATALTRLSWASGL